MSKKHTRNQFRRRKRRRLLPSWLTKFFREEDGPTATEYAILLALIMLTMFVAIQATGNPVKGTWQDSAKDMNKAVKGN